MGNSALKPLMLIVNSVGKINGAYLFDYLWATFIHFCSLISSTHYLSWGPFLDTLISYIWFKTDKVNVNV